MNLHEGYNDVKSCNMNIFVKASYWYLVFSRFSQMIFCGTSQFRHVKIGFHRNIPLTYGK